MTLDYKTRTYHHIRRKLLRGEGGDGRSLSDRTLARELGISRTPVRAALLQLESEGLLQSVPRSGTKARQMSVEEYEELQDVRELMEGYAAARAAKMATPADLEALGNACQETLAATRALRETRMTNRDSDLFTRFVNTDISFHRTLVAASRSRWASKFLDDCHVLTRIFQFGRDIPTAYSLLGEAARVYRDHRHIYDAVRRRDPAAAHDAIVRHLRISRLPDKDL